MPARTSRSRHERRHRVRRLNEAARRLTQVPAARQREPAVWGHGRSRSRRLSPRHCQVKAFQLHMMQPKDDKLPDIPRFWQPSAEGEFNVGFANLTMPPRARQSSTPPNPRSCPSSSIVPNGEPPTQSSITNASPPSSCVNPAPLRYPDRSVQQGGASPEPPPRAAAVRPRGSPPSTGQTSRSQGWRRLKSSIMPRIRWASAAAVRIMEVPWTR